MRAQRRRKSFASFQLVPQHLAKGRVMRRLTKEQQREIAAMAAKRDEEIDLSNYESAEKAEVVRIISARAATSRERKSYEEAYQRTATRNRRHRRQARRRD